MTSSPVRRRSLVTLLVATALGAGSISAAVSASADGGPPTPGAPGIGDRLYPTLGNGGYDALHYDLDLRYATSAPSQGIDGTVTMAARATQALSQFDLDFSGDTVGSVSVDGQPAQLRRDGEELVITPARPIRRDATFVVRVEHFTSHPIVPDPDVLLSAAFFITPDGSATAGQPNAMHSVYPSNDHPRDKATFTIRFDVPAGETAVGNGVLVDTRTRGDRSSWTYLQRQPMATELTQLVVGAFSVVPRDDVDGVPVRDVLPTRLVSVYQDELAVERDHLSWMQDRVGRYPFDLYGSLVVDSTLGFALETQTLSLYDTPWFTYPQGLWDPVMLHELSHQWFGDSVAPSEWSDVWLNEGHASWYEFTYAEQKGFLPDDAGAQTVDELMQQVYGLGDQWRQDFGPVAKPLSGDLAVLFGPNSYYGGALVLYALRQEVGDPTFQRIERAWVHRFEGCSASTADFIDLASQVAHRDLGGFLSAWLYGTTTPAMPGHPDWTVTPAQPADAPAAAAVGAGSRTRPLGSLGG
jgi:aminopeptidase N